MKLYHLPFASNITNNTPNTAAKTDYTLQSFPQWQAINAAIGAITNQSTSNGCQFLDNKVSINKNSHSYLWKLLEFYF